MSRFRTMPLLPAEHKYGIYKVENVATAIVVSGNFACEQFKQKELPVLKFGERLFRPRAALEEMLEKV